MSEMNELSLTESLLELLDCPECSSGQGLRQESGKLICPNCAREFDLTRVDGPDKLGLLIPDFLDSDEASDALS